MFPIPAREVNKTVPTGKILAELFFRPSSVIVFLLLLTYLCSPISAGSYQSISPSQYSEFDVLGVPPPLAL